MAAETVTVCSACFRASCWQGIFMCDDAPSAGTIEQTPAEVADRLFREIAAISPPSGMLWSSTGTRGRHAASATHRQRRSRET
jgi:hypothetical protein